jgi:LuxR family maltose regulon positive regulatory protein
LLDRLLQAVTTQPLTLVSAPAGSGKTTAVVALRQTHSDLSLAWVTLDADDNDPANFLLS